MPARIPVELFRAATQLTLAAESHAKAFRTAEQLIDDYFEFLNSRTPEEKARTYARWMFGEDPEEAPSAKAMGSVEIVWANEQANIATLYASGSRERMKIAETHGLGIFSVQRSYRHKDGRTERRSLWFVANWEQASSLCIGQIAEVITRSRRDPRGRKILCQCRIDTCGKWFFAFRAKEADPRLGLPQRSYCSPEHQQLGRLLTRRKWNKRSKQGTQASKPK